MPSKPVILIRPDQLGSGGVNGVDPFPGGWHMLAEGDSWFSFGSVGGNSLLNALHFERKTLVTSCSKPGDTLRHMVDWKRDPWFSRLLDGGRNANLAWTFDAVLLSAGGNDLIDAVSDKFVDQQLLKLIAPGATPASAADCVHDDAWEKFETYLRANFTELSAFVGNSRKNADTPIFIHAYDYPTPNDAPSLRHVSGPWLFPAMVAHNIPHALWTALADHLIDRLAGVLQTLDLANVHLIDTRGTCQRAVLGATGRSNDWINEIHPTSGGYAKLADRVQGAVEAVLD